MKWKREGKRKKERNTTSNFRPHSGNYGLLAASRLIDWLIDWRRPMDIRFRLTSFMPIPLDNAILFSFCSLKENNAMPSNEYNNEELYQERRREQFELSSDNRCVLTCFCTHYWLLYICTVTTRIAHIVILSCFSSLIISFLVQNGT